MTGGKNAVCDAEPELLQGIDGDIEVPAVFEREHNGLLILRDTNTHLLGRSINVNKIWGVVG